MNIVNNENINMLNDNLSNTNIKFEISKKELNEDIKIINDQIEKIDNLIINTEDSLTESNRNISYMENNYLELRKTVYTLTPLLNKKPFETTKY
jgi:septal ring factor EnvC (AmiA/AmiB activator)